MGLFSFSKKPARSVALIDIGSASVGGAYAHFVEGQQPVIYYTARVDIEPREGEPITDSMLRALSFLERLMIEEGAPALRRETRDAHIDEVLVSIAAPWQETRVITTHIQERKPFTFSRAHLDAADRAAGIPKDRERSGRTIIATILNGYETPNPFGKRATRADLIMLSSSIEKDAARLIELSLRRAFHTHDITLTAFAPVGYTVFRDLYPHQKDFVILDVSGSGTDMAFVKRGLLADTRTVPFGIHDLLRAATVAGQRAHLNDSALIDPAANASFAKEEEAIRRLWLSGLEEAFAAFAKAQALPRTVFLLADQSVREYLKRLLEGSDLRALWLTNDPLCVVALTPASLATRVKTRGLGEGDLFLALLALYAARTAGITPPEDIPTAS
ncbi:MAG TPA: hypothetical protein VGE23_00935 [Candidatus Paceibacterota bacterium]